MNVEQNERMEREYGRMIASFRFALLLVMAGAVIALAVLAFAFMWLLPAFWR